MATQFQNLQETLKSPAISDAAKKTAEADAQRLLGDLQKKEQELAQFRQQADQYLQQGIATTRQQLIGEIANVAGEVAKRKGITMLVERNALAYSDPGYDITDDVIVELNKNKPASSTVPSVGLPATGAKK